MGFWEAQGVGRCPGAGGEPGPVLHPVRSLGKNDGPVENVSLRRLFESCFDVFKMERSKRLAVVVFFWGGWVNDFCSLLNAH